MLDEYIFISSYHQVKYTILISFSFLLFPNGLCRHFTKKNIVSCYYQSWNCAYLQTACFDYFVYASGWQMEWAKGEWNIPRPAVGGVHNWNGCTIRFSVLYFKLLEINSHTFGECTHWPNKKFWIYVWTKLELYNFQETHLVKCPEIYAII